METSTRDSGLMTKPKASAPTRMRTAHAMRGSGLMTNNTGLGSSHGLMAHSMKVITWRVRKKVVGSSHSQTQATTKENFITMKSLGSATTTGLTASIMRANGPETKWKAKASFNGRTARDMKVRLKMINVKEKARLLG